MSINLSNVVSVEVQIRSFLFIIFIRVFNLILNLFFVLMIANHYAKV